MNEKSFINFAQFGRATPYLHNGMMVIEDDNGIVRYFLFYFGLFPFREEEGTTLARSKNKALALTNFTKPSGQYNKLFKAVITQLAAYFSKILTELST
jgi:hypothetical protein